MIAGGVNARDERKGERTMEILKIADGRMKITLTKEDLAAYEIDADAIDYARPETRRAFDALLALAGIRTDAPLGRTYIQLYPSKDGGCEIFVSKKERRAESVLPVPAEKRSGYFLFPARGGERRLCAIFADAGISGGLYLDFSGNVCIFCRTDGRGLPLLEEFGTKAGASLEVYLREHFSYIGELCPRT